MVEREWGTQKNFSCRIVLFFAKKSGCANLDCRVTPTSLPNDGPEINSAFPERLIRGIWLGLATTSPTIC
jgi:hypothetical protein